MSHGASHALADPQTATRSRRGDSHHDADRLQFEQFSPHPAPQLGRSTSPGSSRLRSPPLPAYRSQDAMSHSQHRRHASYANPAFHPYRPSPAPPPAPNPSKPILFVDATFQPGGPMTADYSGTGIPHCRPKRKRITPEQLTKLVEVFETTDNPCFDVRESVGEEIGMSNREVQVWFQNRRAKVARERAAALAKENTARSSASADPESSQSPPPRDASPIDPVTVTSSQHQWRFSTNRAAPASNPVALARPPHPTQHEQPQPRGDSSVPYYRKMFGDQRILLPRSGSPLLSPPLQSSGSSSSNSASYFPNVATPPLSYTATTPGAGSPTSTIGFSDGFRSEEPSPLIPLSSPSHAFTRLDLRSPDERIYDREPFFFASAELPSPNPSETEEFIRLAPLRGWDPSLTPRASMSFAEPIPKRRRSLSNPEAALARPMSRPAPHRSVSSTIRLPSIRDLLNPIGDVSPAARSASLGSPSLHPSSTAALHNVRDPAHALPPTHPTASTEFARPPLSSRHSADSSAFYPPSTSLLAHGDARTLTGLGMIAGANSTLSTRGRSATTTSRPPRPRTVHFDDQHHHHS
ncbi:hypothetical protein JCM10212_003414 [Sporobolomyces blumeae]